MIDTFEVENTDADWVFAPERHISVPTVFVTHLILNIANKTNKDSNDTCVLCVEKRIKNTDDFFSVCFKREKIAKTINEKVVEFQLPIPLSNGDQLRVEYDNKSKGKVKLLVLWHR